jgi:hypothetical protein
MRVQVPPPAPRLAVSSTILACRKAPLIPSSPNWARKAQTCAGGARSDSRAHSFRHADDTTPHFDREQEPPSQWGMKHPGGRDYEGDCRSWRIAICSCDAGRDNSDAFLIDGITNPSEAPQISLRILWNVKCMQHFCRVFGLPDVHDPKFADRQLKFLAIHGGGLCR